MGRKLLMLLFCVTFLSALVISPGCARKSKPVSPKFSEEPAAEPVGEEAESMAAERPTLESRLGEGMGESFEEGELPIEQTPLAREYIMEEARSELQTIYFDYDKSALKPEAKRKLERAANWLKQNPEVHIRIEGHCDERGSNEYNLALGERRALSARRYLISLGVNTERIFTISYGEERPAVEGHDESAWKFNRRDEFKVISF